jgi:hypothetical protein
MKADAREFLRDQIERDQLVEVCDCNMCKIGNPYCARKHIAIDAQWMQAI